MDFSVDYQHFHVVEVKRAKGNARLDKYEAHHHSPPPFLGVFIYLFCFLSGYESTQTRMNVNETYGKAQPGALKTHMLVIQNIFTIFHDALFSLEICNS